MKAVPSEKNPIVKCLDKFQSSDNDYRYMAANDVLDFLNQPDCRIEDGIAQLMASSLIELLKDKNSNDDVRNMSIKCLSKLGQKAKAPTFEYMLNNLSYLLHDSDKEKNELASLALKNLIKGLNQKEAPINKLVNFFQKLLDTITSMESTEIQNDIAEILNELLSRFGSRLLTNVDKTPDVELQSKCLEVMLPLLIHDRSTLRKSSAVFLGNLSPHLIEPRNKDLISVLNCELDNTQDVEEMSERQLEQTIIIIFAFSTICRCDPIRMGKIFPTIIPKLIKFMEHSNNELIDACFQAFESFALFCSKEISPFITQLCEISLNFISYDPNYNDEGSDEELSDQMEDDLFEDDDEFADGFSDDEDDSWKVRRSSAKLLKVLISVSPSSLLYFHENVAPTLIKRFNEREEAVRIEVIHAFIVLLQQTHAPETFDLKGNGSADYTAASSDDGDGNKRRKITSPIPQTADISDFQTSHRLLYNYLSRIFKKIADIFKGNSIPSHNVSILLINQLTLTLPGSLTDYLTILESNKSKIFFNEASKTFSLTPSHSLPLKKDGLELLKNILKTHPYDAFGDHLSWICPIIIDPFNNKVIRPYNESYTACSEFIDLLIPFKNDGIVSGEHVDSCLQYLKMIHNALLEHILVNEVDQASREHSLKLLGKLLYQAGSLILAEFEISSGAISNLVESEASGLAAIQTISTILESPNFDWESVNENKIITSNLTKVVAIILPSLRKPNRSLNIGTLSCISGLLNIFGSHISVETFDNTFIEVKNILKTFNLQELTYCVSILESFISEKLEYSIREHNINLIGQVEMFQMFSDISLSIHLQGSASDKFSRFLSQIIFVANEFKFDITTISKNYIESLLKPLSSAQPNENFTKKVYVNISQCITSIIYAYSECVEGGIEKFVPTFSRVAQNTQLSHNERNISFLVLGKLSLNMDLSQYIDLASSSLKVFGSSNSELRLAAAYALGCWTANNLDVALPDLLDKIINMEKERYLLLHSLKEAILYHTVTNFEGRSIVPYEDSLWELLMSDSVTKSSEESSQNLIAECVGKLTLSNPAKFLPLLDEKVREAPPYVRSIIIISLRYTFSDNLSNPENEFANHLKLYLPDFLQLMGDDDLAVRRFAVLTLNSAGHIMPRLIHSSLHSLLPMLLAETEIKKELIRTVVMGTSKLQVDDGLENRKAAYECIYTLLDTSPRYLNIDAIVSGPIINGLEDLYEIKLLSHMMILRLIKFNPNHLVQYLDSISQIFIKELEKVLAKSPIKQDLDKQNELTKSILKVVAFLEHSLKLNVSIPGFDSLLKFIRISPHFPDYTTASVFASTSSI